MSDNTTRRIATLINGSVERRVYADGATVDRTSGIVTAEKRIDENPVEYVDELVAKWGWRVVEDRTAGAR